MSDEESQYEQSQGYASDPGDEAEASARQLVERVGQKYQKIVQDLPGDDDATENQLALMIFKKALETFKLKSMSRSDSFYGINGSQEKSTYCDHMIQRARVLRELGELRMEVMLDENLLAGQKKELSDKLIKITMYVHYLGLATQYVEVAHQVRSGKMDDVDRSLRERILKDVPSAFKFTKTSYPQSSHSIDDGYDAALTELAKYKLRHMGGKLYGKHFIEDYCSECKECGRYYNEHSVGSDLDCEEFVPLGNKIWSQTWKTVNELPYLTVGTWELVKEGDTDERQLEANKLLPEIDSILKKLFCDNKNPCTFYIFSNTKDAYRQLKERICEHAEDPRLPPLRIRKDCFSMQNGVLETKGEAKFNIDADGIGTGYARFTSFDEATSKTKQCVKFLPNCFFLKAWAIDFNTGQGVTSDLDTPFFDKILLDQGYSLADVRWVMAVCFGRPLSMQHPAYVNDRWDIGALLHGHAGTGKSLLIDVLKALFEKNCVAVLSANGSKSFGLECAVGNDGTTKDLMVCTEFSKEVKVGIQPLKSLIVGEPVNVNRKNKTEVTTRGQIPVVFACNSIPDMENQEGQMERRWFIFDFKRPLKKVNTALLEAIKGELHKLVFKATANYHYLVRELGTTPPLRWPLLPKRFRDNARALRKFNPLDTFLRNPVVTRDPGNYFRPPIDFENVDEYQMPKLVCGPNQYMRQSVLFNLFRKWGCDERRGDIVKKKVKRFDKHMDDNMIRTTFNSFMLRGVRKRMLWFDELGQVATETKIPEDWVLGIGFRTYVDPDDEDAVTPEHFDFDTFYAQHGSLKDISDEAEFENIVDDDDDDPAYRIRVRLRRGARHECVKNIGEMCVKDIDTGLKREWSRTIRGGGEITMYIKKEGSPTKRLKLTY